VAVTTALRVEYEGELETAGLDLSELLGLSDAEASVVGSLARASGAAPRL
jgi:hypothetical protein